MPAQNIKRNLAAVASAAALGLGAAAVALSPGAATPAPATASSISPQTWQSLGTRSGGEVVTGDLYSFFGDGAIRWITDPGASAPAGQAQGSASGGEVVTMGLYSFDLPILPYIEQDSPY